MRGPSDLAKLIEENGIAARLIPAGDAATSMKAATALGVEISRIVKTVVFIDNEGKPHAVVLLGSRRVNQSKLAKLLGVRRVRLATRSEVAELTGYEAGGVPPIGIPIDTIIDSELAAINGEVYAGGGDPSTLLEIRVEDIIKIQRPRIMAVTDTSSIDEKSI